MSLQPELRRLLLATERTDFDAGAERIALALAQRMRAPLSMVLPFATNEEWLATEPALALEAEAKAAVALRMLADQALAAGVATTPIVRRGIAAWQEIVAAAACEEADLLVTRRVGKRGFLARLLVGEMVSQVAAQAPCPVLMVPAEATALWSRRVIVPPSPSARHAEPVARALAGLTGARVERPDGSLGKASAAATAADLLVIALEAAQVVSGRLEQSVEAAIGAAPCPAVMVPPHKRGAGTSAPSAR